MDKHTYIVASIIITAFIGVFAGIILSLNHFTEEASVVSIVSVIICLVGFFFLFKYLNTDDEN